MLELVCKTKGLLVIQAEIFVKMTKISDKIGRFQEEPRFEQNTSSSIKHWSLVSGHLRWVCVDNTLFLTVALIFLQNTVLFKSMSMQFVTSHITQGITEQQFFK